MTQQKQRLTIYLAADSIYLFIYLFKVVSFIVFIIVRSMNLSVGDVQGNCGETTNSELSVRGG